jgi:hypothetical protein
VRKVPGATFSSRMSSGRAWGRGSTDAEFLLAFLFHHRRHDVLVGILIVPFTLFVAATIVRQRRTPASSVTWLLTILFMPLIGIPLFWLFGTRKIDRIARNKPRVELTAQDATGPGAAHPAMMQGG